jgi:RNA polymerase primary sigma factor
MKRREFITPLESAARNTNATKQREQVPKKESPETALDSPPIDLWDDAVKELIRGAKKRGYVTHDQINALLPSEEVQSEQIEDILVMFSEMRVNVVETKEAEPEETPEDAKEEPEEEESDGELMEVRRPTPAESKKSEPGERTDDPVRMYLREMGSVELLSREGEIAIAKRIEAGREAMITGLCESPLTVQAIIIWRDELNDSRVFLRDIIDLEATYAGPDAKAVSAIPAGDGAATPEGAASRPPRTAAPTAATPFGAKPKILPGEPEPTDPPEGELDEDDLENSMSLAAIEAELKPKVLETFDNVADSYKRLRRLQDQDIENRLKNQSLSPAQERKYKKLKDEIIAEMKSLRLNQARINSLVEQLYAINKRLVGYEGRMMRLAESHGVAARTSSRTTSARSSIRAGSTASPSFPPRAGRTSLPATRIALRICARTSTSWRARPAWTSRSSARSSTWCRRASARRVRPRRRWWRPICASSSRSRRNIPTAACSFSI